MSENKNVAAVSEERFQDAEQNLGEIMNKQNVAEPIEAELVKSDIDSFPEIKQQTTPVIKLSDGPYVLAGWFAVILVFVVFAGWAVLAPLDSAAVAPGKVVVEHNNRVIDHYEGGIVSEILVEEGQYVKKGTLLVRLSPTQASSELTSVNGRLDDIFTREARLRAERALADEVRFAEDILQRATVDEVLQDLMVGQKELFKARKEALNQQFAIYNQKIEALNEQLQGLVNVVTSLDRRIASYESEVQDWEALFKEQYADKLRLEEMKRELSRLMGEKASHEAQIAQIKVQINETRSQSVLQKRTFIEEAVSELRSIQSEKLDLLSRKMVLVDKLDRVEIRSPVDGRVKGLKVYTIGGVVRPGDPLMEVVPETDQYTVLARVAVTDIDKVVNGLLTDIRFSAFSSQTTHVIEGLVTNVSPDSFEDPNSGERYFEARVLVTDKGVKQMKEDGVFMTAGMPAEVMIKTGERTFLGYLIKPFTDMFARSFNED